MKAYTFLGDFLVIIGFILFEECLKRDIIDFWHEFFWRFVSAAVGGFTCGRANVCNGILALNIICALLLIYIYVK